MEKKNNIFLITITALLFSIKWIYSFINFPGEEIILKTILNQSQIVTFIMLKFYQI